MAEMVKKATRESFGEALCALAETNPDIVVLDADLAEATKTGIFKKQYPDRFFDCGIAEQNMVGIAAGLAACGKIPLRLPLPCLPLAAPLSRCATLLAILI